MSECLHELHEYFAAETAAERERVARELGLCEQCLHEIQELEQAERSLRSMHQEVGDLPWQRTADMQRRNSIVATTQVYQRSASASWTRLGTRVAAACVIFLCGVWTAQWTSPQQQPALTFRNTEVATAGFDLYVEKSRNLLLGVSALDQSCSDYTSVNVEDFKKASGQLVSELLVLQESLTTHSLDLSATEVELLGKIEEILLHLHSLENDALPDQVRPLSESAQEIVCMVASMNDN